MTSEYFEGLEKVKNPDPLAGIMAATMRGTTWARRKTIKVLTRVTLLYILILWYSAIVENPYKSLYSLHLPEVISTILGQNDHDEQHGKCAISSNPYKSPEIRTNKTILINYKHNKKITWC